MNVLSFSQKILAHVEMSPSPLSFILYANSMELWRIIPHEAICLNRVNNSRGRDIHMRATLSYQSKWIGNYVVKDRKQIKLEVEVKNSKLVDQKESVTNASKMERI